MNSFVSGPLPVDGNLLPLFLVITNLILAILLFMTFIIYKKNPIKQEILLIERYGLIIIYCIIYMIMNLGVAPNTDPNQYSLFHYLYLTFISLYYFNSLSINYEFYKEITNPFYTFISLAEGRKSNIVLEIFGLILSLLEPFLYKFPLREINKITALVNKMYLIIVNPYSLIVYLFFLAINLILLILCLFKLVPIANTKKCYYYKKIFFDIFIDLAEIGYCTLCLISIVYYRKEEAMYINENIINYYAIIIPLVDMILHLHLVNASEMYYYLLGNQFIGGFYRMFGCNNYYVAPLYKTDKSQKISKNSVLTYFHKELHYTCITQFILEYSEYILNCSLCGIALIFDKMKGNHNNSRRLSNPISYNENRITDNLLGDDEYLNSSNKNYKLFKFKFENFTEEEMKYLINIKNTTFDKNNIIDSPNIEIKYFYFDKFSNLISDKNISLDGVKKSILSHYSQYPFLISKNSKHYYFQASKTFSLKSNNTEINIEIFDNVLSETFNNNELELYLTQIGKNQSTFLPFLLGAFKIKINNCSAFTILLSKINIVENFPKDFFNCWQLMRFNNQCEIKEIATSKDKSSFKIIQDEIFQSKKTIQINNYSIFLSTFKEDMNFLSKINSKKFAILIMYYEFDQPGKTISFAQNDSNISISGFNNNTIPGANLRISDVHKESNKEDMSTLNEFNKEFNLEKYKKELTGFEGRFNNFKNMLFFSFENIFEFKSFTTKQIDYAKFRDKFLENFDPLPFDD